MTETNPSLTEFLLARLSEEESAARKVSDALAKDPGAFASIVHDHPELAAGDCAGWLAEYDPARVLADVEAKRRIIGRHSRTPRDHWSGAGNCEGCGFYGEFETPCVTYSEECPELMDLALPYAGHDDYREEWAP